MVWFRVDDKFHRGKKVRRLGADEVAAMARVAAAGLWLLCGDWSSDELTDGFVPWSVVEAWDPQRTLSKRLIDVNLWTEIVVEDEAGIQFHDWDHYNPRGADVLREREANARRAALLRDRDLVQAIRSRDGNRCRYCGTAVRWTDRRSVAGGTYNHVDPNGLLTLANVVVSCRDCASTKGRRTPAEAGMSLLSPAGFSDTRSVLSTDQIGTESVLKTFGPPEPEPETDSGGTETLPGRRPRTQRAPTPRSPKRQGTRLADDFAVTPEMVAWARTNAPRVDGRVETEQFRDYWRSKAGKDGMHLDWVATWRRWMRKAEADIRRPSGASARPGTDDKIRQLQAMKREERRSIDSGESDG